MGSRHEPQNHLPAGSYFWLKRHFGYWEGELRVHGLVYKASGAAPKGLLKKLGQMHAAAAAERSVKP